MEDIGHWMCNKNDAKLKNPGFCIPTLSICELSVAAVKVLSQITELYSNIDLTIEQYNYFNKEEHFKSMAICLKTPNNFRALQAICLIQKLKSKLQVNMILK